LRGVRDEGDIPFDWLHVVFWSGLRGAVSTALALSLPIDFPNRDQLQGITFGVVLFTLLVQDTTADFVVRRWGLKTSGSSRSKASRTDRIDGSETARTIDGSAGSLSSDGAVVSNPAGRTDVGPALNGSPAGRDPGSTS
jgi:NhaP-type Na+/H+ and K+/H+ antiporter